MPGPQHPDEPARPPGVHAEWHDDFAISAIDDEEPEPFTCDVIATADRKLEAAGLPSYTELAELLNGLASPSPSARSRALVDEVLVILHREMKLDRR